MKNNIFDILIVGGGPSGSSAAITASKLGFKTLILDREMFPRDKICGDAFDRKDLTFLDGFGINLSNLDKLKSATINNKLNFYGPKNDLYEYFELGINCYKRYEIDNYLWNSIPSDIIKKENTTITTIEKKDSLYDITLIDKQNNTEFSIKSQFIIGADGYSSYIKRTFFPDLKYTNRVACRYYVSGEKINQDYLGFYFYPEISPGYFWVFPIGENEYNTGVYLPINSSLNAKEIHAFYFSKHFKSNINPTEVKTWPIPNNTNLNDLVYDYSILVGDAAGLCDHLIGHGNGSAIHSANIAINSIHFYLNQVTKKYSLKEIYTYNLNKYIGPYLIKSKFLYLDLGSNKRSFEDIFIDYFNN